MQVGIERLLPPRRPIGRFNQLGTDANTAGIPLTSFPPHRAREQIVDIELLRNLLKSLPHVCLY